MLDSIVTRPYAIDRKEYLASMWALGLPRQLIRTAIVFAVLTIVEFLFWGAATALSFAALLFTIIVALLGVRYLLVRRQVYDSKNEGAFVSRTASFTDSIIHISAVSGTETKTPWSSIIRAERRGTFTLLFLSEVQFLAIPDRAFPSNEDRNEFFTLVARHTLLKGKAPALDAGS